MEERNEEKKKSDFPLVGMERERNNIGLLSFPPG